MTVSFTPEEITFLNDLIASKVQQYSLGIELPELAAAQTIGTGDLMLMRNTSSNTDLAISYQNLLKSIGNTAVDGFTATLDDDEDNSVVLATVNGVAVDKYYEGMKICFKSPLQSNGQVKVKIGTLTYKNLFAYKSTTTAVLDDGDWVEAVYTNSAFYQTNNAQYVYTNDYTVIMVEPNLVAGYTDVYLKSSYGVSKTNYYEGMSLSFICLEDTSGLTRIRVDGLDPKDVLENSGDYLDLIYTPLYKGQVVRLIYDGQSFIKDRFSNLDPKIVPVVAPDPQNPDEPLVPPQNKVEFKVGTNQQFTNLQAAFSAVMKEYGETGRKQGVQQKVVLEVTNVLSVNDNTNTLYSESLDLSWITITATDNVLKFMGQLQNNYHIFRFAGTPSFAEGLTIDITNVSAYVAYFYFMEVDNLFLKNVKIKATADQGIRALFVTSTKQIKKSMTLIDTDILGGEVAFDVKNCEVNLQNVKANSWRDGGVYLNGQSTFAITNSDLSKAGTASTSDILISGSSNTLIQVNSRAKSNKSPGTTDNQGNKYELRSGSQDIQGAS